MHSAFFYGSVAMLVSSLIGSFLIDCRQWSETCRESQIKSGIDGEAITVMG